MITLVLGGARSGKSEYAEKLAARAEAGGCRVTYVATAVAAGDPDFEDRIGRHRERRPDSWATDEPGPELVSYLRAERSTATLLIDSLGTWVASVSDFAVDADGFCAALRARRGDTIVVSEEVGMGVHPSTELGGRFRDAVGTLNQGVANTADQVLLVVAGRALTLGKGG